MRIRSQVLGFGRSSCFGWQTEFIISVTLLGSYMSLRFILQQDLSIQHVKPCLPITLVGHHCSTIACYTIASEMVRHILGCHLKNAKYFMNGPPHACNQKGGGVTAIDHVSKAKHERLVQIKRWIIRFPEYKTSGASVLLTEPASSPHSPLLVLWVSMAFIGSPFPCWS